MLRLRAFIAEVFNSHFPHEAEHNDGWSSYTFKAGAHKDAPRYNVTVAHSDDNKSAHVDFADASNGSTAMNGLHKRDSHRVIGTVKHIIGKHVAANPGLTHVSFTSAEPSRTKLYRHLAGKIDKDHVETGGKDHKNFEVKVR